MGTGKFCRNLKSLIFKLITRIDILSISLWNYHQVNATRSYWWLFNFGPGNGLVPSGNKPLPEPFLIKLVSLGHKELMTSLAIPWTRTYGLWADCHKFWLLQDFWNWCHILIEDHLGCPFLRMSFFLISSAWSQNKYGHWICLMFNFLETLESKLVWFAIIWHNNHMIFYLEKLLECSNERLFSFEGCHLLTRVQSDVNITCCYIIDNAEVVRLHPTWSEHLC